ncbi:hypothetical protein ABK040_014130 [Willaertia magna]
MKFITRLSNSRGYVDHDWLKSYHTFSFANYWDKNYTEFGALRVLNEDVIAPQNGFPLHPHRNYEIFTYVLKGKITHKDSMQNSEVCGRGHVQFTSAGSGIRHSEYNCERNQEAQILQIWVKPRELNTQPNYQLKFFPEESKLNQLCLMIVPKIKGEKNSDEFITIDQNFFVFSSLLEENKSVEHALQVDRQVYIHLPITNSNVELELSSSNNNGTTEKVTLKAGDGCYILPSPGSDDVENLIITGKGSGCLNEFVLMDMERTLF